jgi:hypothetical protein
MASAVIAENEAQQAEAAAGARKRGRAVVIPCGRPG